MILAEEPPPVTHASGHPTTLSFSPFDFFQFLVTLCGASSHLHVSEDELSHKTAIEMEAMNICIPCLRLALRSRP